MQHQQSQALWSSPESFLQCSLALPTLLVPLVPLVLLVLPRRKRRRKRR
jgi:hypothetical protein